MLNRRHFIRSASLEFSGVMLGSCNPSGVSSAKVKSEKTVAEKAKNAMLAMQRAAWEQGVAIQAMIECGDHDMLRLLVHDALVRQTSDGRTCMLGSDNACTDPVAAGYGILKCHKLFGDEKYKQSDTGLPCGMRIRNCFCIFGAMKRIVLRMFIFGEEATVGLLHRSALFMSCCLPISKHIKPKSRAISSNCSKGLQANVRPDGLFNNNVGEADTFTETNLSQMTAFSIFKGVKTGAIDKKYISFANKLKEGALKKADESRYVRDAAGSPYFNSPGTSTEAQAFLLMMPAAEDKLQSL